MLTIPPDFYEPTKQFLTTTFEDEWEERLEDDKIRGGPVVQQIRTLASRKNADNFDLHMFENIRTKGNYSATMQKIASCDAVIYIPYDKETMVLPSDAL